MLPADWYLTADERGNPSTLLDRRHPDGRSWTEGNLVTPLVHGRAYFAALGERVSQMREGDLLLFVDWRGDPDQRLTGERGSEVATLFADAARRGVDVRGLVWRSHWDRLAFSAGENRHLGEDVNAAGGECLLDMRVRLGGSHHQKFVVLRHPGRPELDIAFLGGIDLCHSRRDDSSHAGDPQPQTMAKAYGPRPPWHDIQLALTGPVVGDVETVFRERWEDPQALSRSPIRWAGDAIRRDQAPRRPLPPQQPDPAPTGPHPVQLLRTYGRRLGGYPFAPRGERSVARAYTKAFANARRLIYVEDQYLWSSEVSALLVAALRRSPDLRLVAVLPHQPDQDGAVELRPEPREPRPTARRAARRRARSGRASTGSRTRTGHPSTSTPRSASSTTSGSPWARTTSTGGRGRTTPRCPPRSCTRSSPAACGTSSHGSTSTPGADVALEDHFEAYAASAEALAAWHRAPGAAPRPPGRLRPLDSPEQSRLTRLWAGPLYRLVYDPDGRPLDLRLRRTF